MAIAHNTPPEPEPIVPTEQELKLIAHVRMCRPKKLAKALRRTEEMAVYASEALNAKQLRSVWFVRDLAQRLRRCRVRA